MKFSDNFFYPLTNKVHLCIIINCENEIAACLKAIEGHIVGLYNEKTLEGTTNNIEMMCQKILSKLKVRIELKKK